MIDHFNSQFQLEIEVIKERAIADGTFMKAPSGEDSKLTENQWLQVRTKAFKEWFGDWELAAKMIDIIETEPNSFKNFTEARLWARENIAKTYSNEETGGKGEIRISSTAIGKYLSDSAVSKSESRDIHLSVLKVLPNIIKKSVIGETHADYKKDEKGIRKANNEIHDNIIMHRLYGAVKIDSNVYRVKVTVRDFKDQDRPNTPHSYEAIKIELLAGQSESAVLDVALPRYSNNSISITNLLKGVEKSYEKGKKLLDVSKVVDGNGEPLVVYHGSPNTEISVFNRSQSTRKSSGLKEFGNYFTTNKKVAEKYKEVGNTIEYEKNIDNDILRLEKTLELVRNNKDYLDIIEEIENLKKLKDGKVYPVFLNLRNVYENDGAKLDSYSAKMNIRVPIAYKTAVGWDAIEALAGKNRMAQIEPVNGIIMRNVTELDAGTDDKNYLNELFKEYGGDSFLVFDDNPNQIKSAIDNIGEFSLDNNDIRFRFIGEIGAFNLDKVENATYRLDNLDVARKMEKAKKDEKSIKIATGWERGTDKLWRYETGDAKIKNTLKLGNFTVNRKEEDMMYHMGETLEETIDDDDLFKQYPELKSVKVFTDNKTQSNDHISSGYYSRKNNQIVIHANDVKTLNSLLNHEIQHAIQDIEGFVKGGSASQIWLTGSFHRNGIRNHMYDILWSNNVSSEDMDVFVDSAIDLLKNSSSKKYDKQLEHLFVKYNITEADESNMYDPGEFANKTYQNLTGEVEARNVSSRLNMTDQDRRESLARETEDVARKDQIILENSLGLNMFTSVKKQTIHSNIKQAIDNISKALSTAVEKVESREQLPSHLQNIMKNEGRYPGIYDTKTDKVYVILNEILNEADAQKTILHEVLGHKGLRALKGKGFEKFLDDVCKSMPTDKREEYFQRFNNNKLLATEEYLAEFAEGYKNPSAWKKVKAIFNNFLRSLGINIKINDADLMYTFAKAKDKLNTSSPVKKTSEIAKIIHARTKAHKNVFLLKLRVVFDVDIYKNMVEPLLKANNGSWNKKYKGVVFFSEKDAESFKNSLSDKVLGEKIPVESWKKEKSELKIISRTLHK